MTGIQRPPKLSELLIAFFSMAGVITTQFLYLRDGVMRHEVELQYLKEEQAKTSRQFDKIEVQLQTIISQMGDLKADLNNKANRPETPSK